MEMLLWTPRAFGVWGRGLVLLSAVLLASCAAKGTAIKSSPEMTPQAISAADEKRLANNCPDGAPRALPNWPLGKTQMVYRDGFVLEHSAEWKVPYWVCESIELSELGGNLDRPDDFRPDDELPKSLRAELSDYRGSGYDRGHQAPAGNQTRDMRLKSETFFLSNMIPQNGNQNRNIWRILEETVRDWAADEIATDVKVITGPVFHTDADLIAGYATVTTIGKNEVGVPKAVFKIVSGTVNGTRRVVAFKIDNRAHSQPFDYTKFIVTVEELEKLTGFNYMPGMDISQRDALERTAGTLFRQD
jgi:endonuclease G